MDISGLKNEVKVNELLISGSLSIKTKNEFGVHIFSSSINDDGILSGKLTKPKYNENELIKSIDTIIVELLPIEPPVLERTVPEPIYLAALAEIEVLQLEIEDLNNTIVDLTAKVTELEIVTQSLRVELDGREILVASVENENRQSVSKVQSTIIELQNSIQKATSEVIQRVSLSARNESLLIEVESLRDQLFGKNAKLAEGFKVGEDFAVRVVNYTDRSLADLTFEARANQKGSGEWANGPELELFNFSKDSITVTFNTTGDSRDIINSISSVTLQPNESTIVSVRYNRDNVDKKKPRNEFGTATEDTLYRGSLIASTEKSNINLGLWLRKRRGERFKM
jgi:hypothetical protein